MVSESGIQGSDGDRFSGGEVMNLLFNFFEDSNEGIIGKEAERRSCMVKCEETLLEFRGGHVRFP